ncbi:MAG TPA: hypothetical protein VI136_24060 [Verrucomicrobiae bacterium]
MKTTSISFAFITSTMRPHVRLCDFSTRHIGHIRTLIVSVAVFVVLAMANVCTRADTYQPIDLSSTFNQPLAYLSYTFTPGNILLGGVPFTIPTSGNQMWDGYSAGGGGSDVRTNQFPVGVFGVKSVHTLLNTTWGTAGGPYAWIEFFGSSGAYYRKDLYANVDIRDHSPSNGYPYLINGTTTVKVWDNGLSGSAYNLLDKQQIDLPAEFLTQTLTRICLTDAGHGEYHQRLVFVGATVVTASYPIDLSSTFNQPLSYLSYTFTPGNVLLGGVPFTIPTSGNQIWDGYSAGGAGADVRSNLFPVGVFGVKSVHTLLNTTWGTAGGPYAWIEFYGSSGAYYRKDLYADVDIRDHSPNNGYASQINGTTTIKVWDNGLSGNVYNLLDKQQIDLPAEFLTQTLTRICLTDAGHGEYHQRLVLVGATAVGGADEDLLAAIHISALDICWSGRTNQLYQVQYKTNVSDTNWLNFGVAVQGTGSNCVTDGIKDTERRFYRVTRIP